MQDIAQAQQRTILLWDLPLRIFHWATVLLLAGLWLTEREGRIDLHIKLGMALLFLLVFRIVWGFLGSETARFVRFVKGPAAIRAYLATGRAVDGGPIVGHNPLGALSVVALLAALAAQVGLGLFASDTDATSYGPLNALVSYDTADRITHLHAFVFKGILGLVALHLCAIAVYLAKKERLVRAMVTGRKTFAEPVAVPRRASAWRMIIAALVAVAVCAWVWNGGHILPRPKPAYDVSY